MVSVDKRTDQEPVEIRDQRGTSDLATAPGSVDGAGVNRVLPEDIMIAALDSVAPCDLEAHLK